MKNSIFSMLLLGGTMLSACEKQNSTTSITVMDRVDTTSVVKYSGDFNNGPFGSVSGLAEIRLHNGGYSLVLKNVSISSGPDLHVYLSQEVIPVNFIDLGKLRSLSGTQVYSINGRPDFTRFKYALVHCQLFNHLFGSSLLFQN